MQYRSAKAQLVSSCPTFHLAHITRDLGGVLQESGFLLIFSTSQLRRSFRTLSPPSADLFHYSLTTYFRMLHVPQALPTAEFC